MSDTILRIMCRKYWGSYDGIDENIVSIDDNDIAAMRNAVQWRSSFLKDDVEGLSSVIQRQRTVIKHLRWAIDAHDRDVQVGIGAVEEVRKLRDENARLKEAFARYSHDVGETIGRMAREAAASHTQGGRT